MMDKNTNEIRDVLVTVARDFFGDEYNNHDDEAKNDYDYLFGLLCTMTKVVAAEGVEAHVDSRADHETVTWYTIGEDEIAMTLGPVVANVCPNHEIRADSSYYLEPTD